MGQEKNAENIPFLRSTQPKSTERVPVVELSGYDVPETWRGKALDVRGTALPCGHSPEEECPHRFEEELDAFLMSVP